MLKNNNNSLKTVNIENRLRYIIHKANKQNQIIEENTQSIKRNLREFDKDLEKTYGVLVGANKRITNADWKSYEDEINLEIPAFNNNYIYNNMPSSMDIETEEFKSQPKMEEEKKNFGLLNNITKRKI